MEIQFLCPLLTVFDMKTSLQFYVGILEFKIHESAGEEYDLGWVWLKANNMDLMLNTQYELSDRPELPEENRVKAHRDTILYIGCPKVDQAYLELQRKGIKCNPPQIAPYGMKQLYFNDPDGYGICLQWKQE